MANRIPLIVDVLDSNKIKELPIGDNLDLGGAGVTNAGTINATDIRINNVSFNNPFSGDYNDLTNKPVIPTVPNAISAFANDVGYLSAGTTTDQIAEGTNNLFYTLARVDSRVNAQTGANLNLGQKIISDLKNIEAVTANDDGKVLYYDHPSTSWKWKTDAGGVTKLTQLNDVDAVTSVDHNKILYYDHATTSFKWKLDTSSFTFSVGADDSTLRTISSNESVKFVGGTGITTASDTEGNITITVGNIGDLVDVGTAGATNGQVLTYNSGAGTLGPGTVAAPTNIDDLNDVDTTTTAPVDDYVLSYKDSTSKWEPRQLNNVDAATVTTVANSTAAAQFVTFVATGDSNGQQLRTDASITYNPNTNTLTATSVTGTTVNATNLNVSGSIANGVNEINFTGDVKIASSKEIRYYDTDNSHYMAFKAPADVTASKTFTWPDGDGSANQLMQTDGNGVLSWVTPAATGELNEFSFKTIAVSGQNNVVAETTTDTLTFVAGTNVTLTTDDTADSITINATGGGGTPGGVDAQVQFNDGGSTFGGDAGLVYNKTTDTLTGINAVFTKVTADDIVSSGAGVPTITSASNLILDAANAVVVQKAPLRIGSFDADGVGNLVGQAGDVIYNSSAKQLVFHDGTAWVSTSDPFTFSIGADDSTMRVISTNEGIKFSGGTGIDTTSDAEGNITIKSSGPTIEYDVTANGSSAYRFAGPGIDGTVDNPDLTLYKGFTYIFNNLAGAGHPFEIRISNGGAAFTEGVTGSTTGTQTFIPQHNTSDSALVYQCTNHAAMVGNLTIV